MRLIKAPAPAEEGREEERVRVVGYTGERERGG